GLKICGLTLLELERVESSAGGCAIITAAPTIGICKHHIAVPSSATSTTAPSPVRARRNRAAATPPASAIPLNESPNAPAGCPIGRFAPGGVTVEPTPPRAQKLMES